MPLLPRLQELAMPMALTMARDSKERYQIVKLNNPDEWFGINTLEELDEANKRKSQST